MSSLNFNVTTRIFIVYVVKRPPVSIKTFPITTVLLVDETFLKHIVLFRGRTRDRVMDQAWLELNTVTLDKW